MSARHLLRRRCFFILAGAAAFTLLASMTAEAEIIPVADMLRVKAFLRDHPNLQRLSYKRLTQSAADFWKDFDAAARRD